MGGQPPRSDPGGLTAGRGLASRWPWLIDVLLGLAAHRLAKLTHALAERTGHFGQTLGAEHDESNDGNEDQMDGVLDSH